MFTGLMLVHRAGSKMPLEMGESWTLWKTCLRQIAITQEPMQSAPLLHPGDQLFQGAGAYRFLLEVICGLHSRILGENEIVGQFKAHFLNRHSSAGQKFSQLTQWLLADMKLVRTHHAMNAGPHSYGSYSRRQCEGTSEVCLLGTGELSAAILPWLEMKDRITVYYRSEASRDALMARLAVSHPALLQRLRFLPITDLDRPGSWLGGTLIVAAPVAARRLEQAVQSTAESPARIIDLRGESVQDPLNVMRSRSPSGDADIPVFDLQDFFREAAASNEAAEGLREKALLEVSHLSQLRMDAASIQIRPMGWEDLCG